MKINFRHPKYIVPLITLPFLILGFFIFGGKMKGSPKPATNIPQTGINTAMPGVDTTIAKAQIKDKFDAYQQAFKEARDSTAMADIQRDAYGNNQLVYSEQGVTGYSEHSLDSITSVLNKRKALISKQLEDYNNHENNYSDNIGDETSPNTGYTKNDAYEKLNLSERNSENESSRTENENPASYDNQMRVFKDQMHYLDSIQQEQSGSNINEDKKKDAKSPYAKRFEGGADTSLKVLHISAGNKNASLAFNTVSDFGDDDNNIPAMIDQDIKATLGSRVRIRLLKDMYVGDNLVQKGTYLYGVVTGFQKQRVNISIAQIMYNNVSLPVKVNVFDNDGYLGLYVPGSDFREFTKDIGSQATQGLSQVVTPDNSDVKTNILAGVFNTTTTTLSNLLKKDKAFLKYNYIVFLQEDKTNENNSSIQQ